MIKHLPIVKADQVKHRFLFRTFSDEVTEVLDNIKPTTYVQSLLADSRKEPVHHYVNHRKVITMTVT